MTNTTPPPSQGSSLQPPSTLTSPLAKRQKTSSETDSTETAAPFTSQAALDGVAHLRGPSVNVAASPFQDPKDTSLQAQPPSKAAAGQDVDAAMTQALRNTPATAAILRQENEESHVAALQVKRLNEKAKLPTRGSAFAAGLDLYSSATTTIPAHKWVLVPTSISIATPPGAYARVAPRSGLAVKKGLQVGAGVIDADYRGEVKVLLFNMGSDAVTVDEGERCAQLVLEKYVRSEVVDVDEAGIGQLVETERGAGGFGSTGTSV